MKGFIKRLILLVFALLAALAYGAEPSKTVGDKRPNVLIFITDDESWLDRSSYGWSNLNTPNFDSLSKQGALFSRCYSSAPSCAPARASLLTGRNFWELEQGAYIQAWLPTKFARLPDIMEKHGYEAGFTGKGWGPGVPPPNMPDLRNPAGKAYNRIKLKGVPAGISPIDYAANFEDFINKNSGGKPWVFWVGCIEPHGPYAPDAPKRLKDEFGMDPESIKMPGFIPDNKEMRDTRASIFYELKWADRDLGKIVEILREKGLLDNTLIFITGDNGTQIPYSKATPYDWGVHVPLAVYWKGKIVEGTRIDDFVKFPDFAPTILEAAGIPIPADMSGKSFLKSLLSGKSGRVDSSRDHVVTGLEWHGELPPYNSAARAIRDENYEYIINYARRPPDRIPPNRGPKKPGEVWEELYDLKKDPWTLKNVADDPAYAEVKAKMVAKMNEYLLKTGDPRATGDMKIFDETRKFVESRKSDGYGKKSQKAQSKKKANKASSAKKSAKGKVSPEKKPAKKTEAEGE